MSPDVADAWTAGYKGQKTTITFIDDFSSASKFGGNLTGTSQVLRHGEWTRLEGSMIAPLATIKSKEFRSSTSVSLATGLNVLFANPRSREVDCMTGEILGPWKATAATVGLTEFPAGTYNYDWKTDKSWADTCRVFEITLDDGSFLQATVHFIK